MGIAALGLLGLTALPVVLKWVLVGRWRPTSIPVWSPAYLRFWILKVLIRTNPMVMFTGTPAYSLYLRALGAKIGPGVVLLTRQVPVATDLFSVGGGTLIRKDASVSCYRAHDGHIEIGGVTLGAAEEPGAVDGAGGADTADAPAAGESVPESGDAADTPEPDDTQTETGGEG